MVLNKKAATQLGGVCLIIAMLLLVATAYLYVWGEVVKFHGNIGKTQNEMLRDYHKAELALIYIDQAAKYSVYNSILPIMEEGGFTTEPPCGYDSYLEDNKDYVLWQNVEEITGEEGKFKEEKCYPKMKDIRKSLATSFNKEFNNYAEKYPIPVIPKNNYDLVLEEKEGKLEIMGIATQNLQFPPDINQIRERLLPTFPLEKEIECLLEGGIPEYYDDTGFDFSCNLCPKKPSCKVYRTIKYCDFDPCNFGCEWRDEKCSEMKRDLFYSIKPSFRLEIPFNFIEKFNEYVEKTKEIEKNIQDCLKKGSEKPDDDDLQTCADINKLKKEIEGIGNYQIKPITLTRDYTLLFDIEDTSFNNPYSEERLVIKYGIRFLDKFPPPPTEISGVEERTAEGKNTTYLTWYKNHASDVESYEIYYKKIEDKLGGGEIPAKPPTDISKMTKIEIPIGNEIEWQIDYENTALEKGQKYYFYIRANDNTNNFVKNIDIEPVKLTI